MEGESYQSKSSQAHGGPNAALGALGTTAAERWGQDRRGDMLAPFS